MYLQSEPTVDPALVPSAANGASSTEPFELYFANDTHGIIDKVRSNIIAGAPFVRIRDDVAAMPEIMVCVRVRVCVCGGGGGGVGACAWEGWGGFGKV